MSLSYTTWNTGRGQNKDRAILAIFQSAFKTYTSKWQVLGFPYKDHVNLITLTNTKLLK